MWSRSVVTHEQVKLLSLDRLDILLFHDLVGRHECCFKLPLIIIKNCLEDWIFLKLIICFKRKDGIEWSVMRKIPGIGSLEIEMASRRKRMRWKRFPTWFCFFSFQENLKKGFFLLTFFSLRISILYKTSPWACLFCTLHHSIIHEGPCTVGILVGHGIDQTFVLQATGKFGLP